MSRAKSYREWVHHGCHLIIYLGHYLLAPMSLHSLTTDLSDPLRVNQVGELTAQLHKLETQLAVAQHALRHDTGKSPARSQQLSASLGTLEAASPMQAASASQSTQAGKRLHTELPQATAQMQGARQFAEETASQPTQGKRLCSRSCLTCVCGCIGLNFV